MAKYQATYRAGTSVPDSTIDAMKAVMDENGFSFSEFVNHIWAENVSMKADGLVPSIPEIPEVAEGGSIDIKPILDSIAKTRSDLIEAIGSASPANPTAPASVDSATPATEPTVASVAPAGTVTIPADLLTKDDAIAAKGEIVGQIAAAREAELAKLDLLLEKIEQMGTQPNASVIVENVPVAVATPIPAPAIEPIETTETAETSEDVIVAAAPEDEVADVIDSEQFAIASDPASLATEPVADEEPEIDDDAPSMLTEQEADDIANALAAELWSEEIGDEVETEYDEADALASIDDAAVEAAKDILAGAGAFEADTAIPVMEDEVPVVEAVAVSAEDDEIAPAPEEETQAAVAYEFEARLTETVAAAADGATSDDGDDDETPEEDDEVTFADGEIDDDVLLGLEMLIGD